MKILELVVNPNQISYNSSIRIKKDIIDITLKIISLINLQKFIISESPSMELESGKILVTIYIDKMSRVFITDYDKIHTFQFPFRISIIDSIIYCKHNNIEIDNSVLSVLSASFKEFNEDSSIESMIEALWEFENDFSLSKKNLEDIEKTLLFILTFESGYLRFDHDNKKGHGKKKNDKNHENHPVNHLDLYYSSNNTFKVGLNSRITYEELIGILDINNKCWFLKND